MPRRSPSGSLPPTTRQTGLSLKTTSVDAFRADGAMLDPSALGDPDAFTGGGYMLLGLEIAGPAAQYRDVSTRRGGPTMVVMAPTLPAPGLSHACDVYGASTLVLPDSTRDGVVHARDAVHPGGYQRRAAVSDAVGDRHARRTVDYRG